MQRFSTYSSQTNFSSLKKTNHPKFKKLAANTICLNILQVYKCSLDRFTDHATTNLIEEVKSRGLKKTVSKNVRSLWLEQVIKKHIASGDQFTCQSPKFQWLATMVKENYRNSWQLWTCVKYKDTFYRRVAEAFGLAKMLYSFKAKRHLICATTLSLCLNFWPRSIWKAMLT